MTTSDSFIKIKTPRVPLRLQASLNNWFLDLRAGKHILYIHTYTPHWAAASLWLNLGSLVSYEVPWGRRQERVISCPWPRRRMQLETALWVLATPESGGMRTSSLVPWLPFQTPLRPETWIWILSLKNYIVLGRPAYLFIQSLNKFLLSPNNMFVAVWNWKMEKTRPCLHPQETHSVKAKADYQFQHSIAFSSVKWG